MAENTKAFGIDGDAERCADTMLKLAQVYAALEQPSEDDVGFKNADLLDKYRRKRALTKLSIIEALEAVTRGLKINIGLDR